MGVPVKRLMVTSEDGTKEQFYPISHLNAIDGLKEALKDNEVSVGVSTVNGQSGDITLPVLSESDHVRIMTMVTAFENGEIGGGTGNITLEKVDEI